MFPQVSQCFQFFPVFPQFFEPFPICFLFLGRPKQYTEMKFWSLMSRALRFLINLSTVGLLFCLRTSCALFLLYLALTIKSRGEPFGAACLNRVPFATIIPGMILGHFNIIQFLWESVGDSDMWSSKMEELDGCTNCYDIMDLRTTSCKLTWS